MRNPESIDPIYEDLEKDLKKATSAVDEMAANVEAAKLAMAEVAPRNVMRKRLTREFYEKSKFLEKLRQKATYQQLLLEKRLRFLRTQYLKAYQAKTPWPDPKEVDEYQTNKRLRMASRSWASRVPRLHNPTDGEKPKAKEKKSEKPAATSEGAPAPEHGGGGGGGHG